MSKELETLEDVVFATPEEYDIIKSALERKEKLEKAWKIIKEKKVILSHICKCDDYTEYNAKISVIFYKEAYNNRKLSETEFNLIKEIMEEK